MTKFKYREWSEYAPRRQNLFVKNRDPVIRSADHIVKPLTIHFASSIITHRQTASDSGIASLWKRPVSPSPASHGTQTTNTKRTGFVPSDSL